MGKVFKKKNWQKKLIEYSNDLNATISGHFGHFWQMDFFDAILFAHKQSCASFAKSGLDF
jgi:hypothetical protein